MQRICKLDALAEDIGRGFTVTAAGGAFGVVVVRRGQRVYGYRNVCPHRGTSLDWMPDRFMSVDGAYLQCATHGALFEPESGACVAGPCRGSGLTPVPLHVVDGEVMLAEPGEGPPSQ